MGKRWRKYSVGKYRLGQLHGEAVVCWRDENKNPHRRRLGVHTEIDGRAALDTWVHKATLLKEKSNKLVGEIWKEYREDRAKDGKVIENFDFDWKALKPRFANMDVDAITADICRDYAKDRLAQGKSPSTAWTELTRLRSCINFAHKRRIIVEKPYVWVPQKPSGRKRVMTEEEVIRLIDACKMPHVRLFTILAISTAGRAGAICQLKWTEVDFEAGTIDLKSTERVNPLLKRQLKGRSEVPMTAEARVALLEAKEGALSDHVIEWDGEPVRKVSKAFMGAVERAGLGTREPHPTKPGRTTFVSDVTPHVLRHTVLTWLDEEDIPMERISKLAGHRDVKTTRSIYAKPGVKVLKPAADVIDMRLRGKKEAK